MTETDTELPAGIIDEAERLTRHARDAVDEGEATAARRQRDDLVASHGFVARERDAGVLILYPSDWLEDGAVNIEQIEDTDRAIERPIDEPGAGESWERIEDHNREIVARVTERHGDVHGQNADAFADFMSNHYAKPIEATTHAMREEFLTEYYPRNAWPSQKQRAVIEQSIELTLETARE